MAKLLLEPHDLETPLWKKKEAFLRGRLEELRLANDNENLDQIQTAVIRGQIKMVKEQLNAIPKNK